MDKQQLGNKLLSIVATAVTLPTGPIGRVWAIINNILAFLQAIPKDDMDYFLDLVEANNSRNKTVMVAMRVVRIILNCPDEIGEDQENPV